MNRETRLRMKQPHRNETLARRAMFAVIRRAHGTELLIEHRADVYKHGANYAAA